MSNRKVTFFHATQSRSASTLALMEELGADYELKVLDLKNNEQRGPEYLAINPLGKVPAIVHDGALVTERIAITLYLADLYPEKALAPAIGDALRGPYLRWLAFYAACFEPAIVDKINQHTPPVPSSSPYGDYDTVINTLAKQLEKGPWLLGERFIAADVLWGTALRWTMMVGAVPKLPVFEQYAARVCDRPAVQRASEFDARLLAQQPAA
ncbi:glutathione S-transferase family protein [Solimonas sp. SE-A11]|uniref:glutathione S-transferase family protein n=1 Tax=Solimonas sp. SE-A11 TaxID=3054954 RepID=UPI00259C8D3E|nr:glutathione S-transferase family protein [Solimonas sp. SE-A11]MDM4772512.1 glutathione S-transferase family protein [Solimonas sp. SE-A11]